MEALTMDVMGWGMILFAVVSFLPWLYLMSRNGPERRRLNKPADDDMMDTDDKEN